MIARAVIRLPGAVRPTLAPAILALALIACGVDAPPTGDDTRPAAASSPFKPIAGAAVDAGLPIGTDEASGAEGAPSSGTPPEALSEATPQPGSVPGSGPETDGTDGTDGTDDTGTAPDGDVVASGPVGCDASPDTIRTRALELINAARAEARFCGEGARYPVVDALGWDSRLEMAARAHSTDMATHNFFDHTGSDGSSPGDRIARQGYDWGRYAENIAAGQTTLEAAVTGWLGSPGHCRNLMQADVGDTAIACVSDDGADYRRYWTQVFARSFSSRARP